MITKFARLEFELFTKPSKSDFLQIHQILSVNNNDKDCIRLWEFIFQGVTAMFSGALWAGCRGWNREQQLQDQL